MNRLLQGDVGSGKTIVAVLTLLVAVENGYQGVLMAPTEILADQHARSVLKLLQEAGSDVKVGVLTGSLKAAAKRRALEDIATGRAQLVIAPWRSTCRLARSHTRGCRRAARMGRRG